MGERGNRKAILFTWRLRNSQDSTLLSFVSSFGTALLILLRASILGMFPWIHLSFVEHFFFLWEWASLQLKWHKGCVYCASKRSANSQANWVVFLLKFFFMHFFHSSHTVMLRTAGATLLDQWQCYSFAWFCALRTKIGEGADRAVWNGHSRLNAPVWFPKHIFKALRTILSSVLGTLNCLCK